jgi:hypothetical protein
MQPEVPIIAILKTGKPSLREQANDATKCFVYNMPFHNVLFSLQSDGLSYAVFTPAGAGRRSQHTCRMLADIAKNWDSTRDDAPFSSKQYLRQLRENISFLRVCTIINHSGPEVLG